MNEAKRLLSDWCYMNCDAPPRPPEIAQIVETAYSVLDNGKQNSNAYSPRVPFESPILVHAAKPKTKLEWALAHARMGFNVFPLKPNSKKPLIEGWQIAATGNEAKIREWWTRNPDANIGINTDGP